MPEITSYSLEEINTGELWIDGSPIYKRTFKMDSISRGDHVISNQVLVDAIIRFELMYSYTRYGYDIIWNDQIGNEGVVLKVYRESNHIPMLYSGSPHGYDESYITLWYTKFTQV